MDQNMLLALLQSLCVGGNAHGPAFAKPLQQAPMPQQPQPQPQQPMSAMAPEALPRMPSDPLPPAMPDFKAQMQSWRQQRPQFDFKSFGQPGQMGQFRSQMQDWFKSRPMRPRQTGALSQPTAPTPPTSPMA